MAAKLIDVYCVHQGDDDRSPGYPAFFYSNESQAKAKAKGIGWYGGDAPVRKRRGICFDGDKVYLLDADHSRPIDLDDKRKQARQEIRKAALTKLTPEERKALRLKET